MDPRKLRLVALPVIVVVLLAACSSRQSPAVTVDGQDITDAQLAHEADLFAFLAALNQAPCGTAEQGESVESACNRFALANLIQERFVTVYAADNGIEVTAAEVDRIIGTLDQQVGAGRVDQELTKRGLTRTDLKELAGEVLLFQGVQEAVVEEELGEERLQELYQEGILGFTTLQVGHILVDTEAEADDVYARVTAKGATQKTFENLARKVSTDTGSGQNGGSLGSAVASTYVPAFANAAAALEPGEISRPVQTEFGWHVIRLEEKQVTSFEEAKPRLVQGESIVVFNDWLRTQAQERGVEVNPRFGRYDAETLSVVTVRSTDPSATTAPSPGESGVVTPVP